MAYINFKNQKNALGIRFLKRFLRLSEYYNIGMLNSLTKIVFSQLNKHNQA